MSTKTGSPFTVGESVWVRSYNLHKSGIAIVNHIGVNALNGEEWAEVVLATDYFDWDKENGFIKTGDNPTLQVPLYRLEHIKD